jgi:hypothetical protein
MIRAHGRNRCPRTADLDAIAQAGLVARVKVSATEPLEAAILRLEGAAT